MCLLACLSGSQIVEDCIAIVRQDIGAVVAFKAATTVARLPKTRSGKTLRGTMKAMANGTPHTVPPTIDDATVLPEIAEALASLGYPTATSN